MNSSNQSGRVKGRENDFKYFKGGDIFKKGEVKQSFKHLTVLCAVLESSTTLKKSFSNVVCGKPLIFSFDLIISPVCSPVSGFKYSWWPEVVNLSS